MSTGTGTVHRNTTKTQSGNEWPGAAVIDQSHGGGSKDRPITRQRRRRLTNHTAAAAATDQSHHLQGLACRRRAPSA